MEWFIFAMFAAFFWAIVNIVDKYSLERLMRNSVSYQILVCLSDILVLVPLILFTKVSFAYPWYLWSILIGFILGFVFILYNKALMTEEVSRVSLMTYMTPLMVLPLAYVFIGEIISIRQLVGVLLLVSSAVMISYRRTNGKFKISKAVWYILALDLAYAVLTITEKYFFGFIDYASFLFWTLVGSVITGLFFLLIPKLRKDFLNDISRTDQKKLIFWRVVNLSLYYLGMILFYVALNQGMASIVTAVPSFQPFFVFLFALLMSFFMPKVLSENMSRRTILIKIISLSLLLLGTFLAVS